MTNRHRQNVPGPNRTGTTQTSLVEPLGRRLLRVMRVASITPRYRRIVLAGDDLGADFPDVPFAPTDHVKLFFPDPRTGDLVFPEIGPRGWKTAEGPAPLYRDYTVRGFDAERCELTIDFVVHEHGVAGLWARDAAPGDEIGVLGPRGIVRFPEDCEHYIVAGDETALPAIARIIEEAPAGSRVTAVIEIADDGERQPLAGTADLDLRWVPRDSAPVGDGHLSPLETAVRALTIDPAQRLFVFAAGEATALVPIRRYLRRDLGLPKERVDVDGYWKRGITNLDHHANDLTDGDDDGGGSDSDDPDRGAAPASASAGA